MNHKALTVNLRWLSILLAFGMIQADSLNHFGNPAMVVLCLVYLASNLGLMVVARDRFSHHPAWFGLALLDVAIISAIIAQLGVRGDSFFLYLPVIASASCHHGQRGILATVGTATVAYAGLWYREMPEALREGALMAHEAPLFRLLLLVVVGVFFGYLAQRLRLQIQGSDALAAERRDLEAVIGATHAFSTTLKQNELLGQLIQQVVGMVSAFRCSVCHVDEDGTVGTLLISREILASREGLGSRTLKIDLNNYPELKLAMARQGPVVVNDIHGSEMMDPVAATLRQVGINALLVVPITLDDPVVGTLLLGLARKDDPFSERDVKIGELLAGIAANVIKNAYLHENLASQNLTLQKLAISDPLTGLYNRRFFDVRLSEEFRLAARHLVPLSVILLDIDHFKRVNDTHGHPAGDRVLVEIARVVQRTLRHSDCLARYGGEEFVLLLPLTDGEGARAKAEEIRAAIKGIALEVGGQVLTVTASLGVARYDAATCPDPEALVSEADHALYLAKRSGRDQVQAFSPAADPVV